VDSLALIRRLSVAQRYGSVPPSPRTVKSDPLHSLEDHRSEFGGWPSSAQRRWTLSHTSRGVKFPPQSSTAVRSLDLQVLGSEAHGRPWRNEGGVHHTPQRLLNPRQRALTILGSSVLSGTRPSTAQRGPTIPPSHDPVKSGWDCSLVPCAPTREQARKRSQIPDSSTDGQGRRFSVYFARYVSAHKNILFYAGHDCPHKRPRCRNRSIVRWRHHLQPS
jgi:hypothetical protein